MSDEQRTSLQLEVEALRAQVHALEVARGAHPLGHFYSPVPSPEDIAGRLRQLEQCAVPRQLPEIDLRAERQLARLSLIGATIEYQPPFPEQQTDGFRYYFENSQYSYNDAITLHGMLRSLGPKRLIEIGSGFSSALILDTNERYLSGSLSCNFIEPYIERLDALLRATDRNECRIYEARVQDVDLHIFSSLAANDVLFIDSSHVMKYGSDLEYILREVLPLLAPGVYIHFHDIFYPFEYPEAWIKAGHFWNECYMIRAFLANNTSYRIELFSDYIAHFHRAELEAVSPLCLKNTGANLWLSKVSSR